MLGLRLKKAIRLGRKRFSKHRFGDYLRERQERDVLIGRNVSSNDILDLRFELALRRTGSPCSNFCCGNARRHFDVLTRQELKSAEAGRWELSQWEIQTNLSGYAVSKLEKRRFGRVRRDRVK